VRIRPKANAGRVRADWTGIQGFQRQVTTSDAKSASGRAVVYLLGEGTIGVDGKSVGAVHDGTYSVLEMGAGEHLLCSAFSTPIPVIFLLWKKVYFASAHPLNAEAGGTDYFQS
jgi:hypothetical protein